MNTPDANPVIILTDLIKSGKLDEPSKLLDIPVNDIIIDAIMHDVNAMLLIPENLLSDTLLLSIVLKKPYAIIHIPTEKMTPGIISIVISRLPNAIDYIPIDKLTDDNLLMCVRANEQNLQYVQQDKITREMLCAAITSYTGSNWSIEHFFKYAPESMFDDDIIIAILRRCTLAIHNIPRHKLSEHIVEMAIKNDPQIFSIMFGQEHKDIYSDFLTIDIIKLAVTLNGNALGVVTESLLSDDIIKLSVSHFPHSIRHVSDNMLSDEIFMLAVQIDGMSLQYIPKHRITRKIASVAVQTDGHALELVPHDIIDNDIVWLALHKTGSALQYVPNSLLCDEFVKMAVHKSGTAIAYVKPDSKYMTEELVISAVETSGCAIEYIPVHMITQTVAKLAAETYGDAIKFIPDSMITTEIAKLSTARNGLSIRWVPDTVIDDEIIIGAFNNIPNAIKYVPKNKISHNVVKYVALYDPVYLNWIPYDLITEDIIIDVLLNSRSARPTINGLIDTDLYLSRVFSGSDLYTLITINVIEQYIKTKKIISQCMIDLFNFLTQRHLSQYDQHIKTKLMQCKKYNLANYREINTATELEQLLGKNTKKRQREPCAIEKFDTITESSNAENYNCLICGSDGIIDLRCNQKYDHCYCIECFKQWFCQNDKQVYNTSCVGCNINLNIDDIELI